MAGPLLDTQPGNDLGRIIPTERAAEDGDYVIALGRETAGHVLDLSIGDRLVISQVAARDVDEMLSIGAVLLRPAATQAWASRSGPWDVSEEPVLTFEVDGVETEIVLETAAFADPAAALAEELVPVLSAVAGISCEVEDGRVVIYTDAEEVRIHDPSAVGMARLVWLARLLRDASVCREVEIVPGRSRELHDVGVYLGTGEETTITIELELRLEGERFGMRVDDDVVMFWTMANGAIGTAGIGDPVVDTGRLAKNVSPDVPLFDAFIGGPVRDRWARRFISPLGGGGSTAIGADAAAELCGEVTVEMWARLDADADGIALTVAGDSTTSAEHVILQVSVASGRAIEYGHDVAGVLQTVATAGAVFELGTWFHLAVTRQDAGGGATEVTIYVDGEEVCSGASTTPSGGSAATVRLGTGPTLGLLTFQGALGDVRVIDRVLTPSEIASHAELLSWTFVHPTDDGELLRYRMDDVPNLVDAVGTAHATASFFTPAGAIELGVGRVDLVGSRGHAVRTDGDYKVYPPDAATVRTTLLAMEWTVEMFLLAQPGATGFVLIFDGGSESASDNMLLGISIQSGRLVRVEWERGTGTDVVFTTADEAFTEAGEGGVIHLAVTCTEDPDTPGSVLVAVYASGVLVEESSPLLPPTGGEESILTLGGDWPGRVQEVRLSSVARTANEIRLSAATRRP